MRVKNMIDVLRTRADAHPDGVAYLSRIRRTCRKHAGLGALDRRGRALGASIAARVDPGARMLIMLPPGIDFVAAVFGVFYAGAIANTDVSAGWLARRPHDRPRAWHGG